MSQPSFRGSRLQPLLAWLALGLAGVGAASAQPAPPGRATLGSPVEGETGQRVRTIAVVRDGASWYFDARLQRFLEELEPLARGHYRFRIEDEFDAQYDPDRVSVLLKRALEDPEVDLVYASGTIASERAGRLTDAERTRPIVASALKFSDVRAHPVSQDGTSTLTNYTFITAPKRVAADAALSRLLSGTNVIHVLIDELLLPELPEVEEAKGVYEDALGLTIHLHGIPPEPEAALKRIPAGTGSLYITILPRMSEADRRRLYAGVARLGIPAVTMLGRPEVELGAMAGLAPDDPAAVARRTALDVHQLLQGVSTASLPVYLPVQDHLVINAATAQATGWSPTYEITLEAEFLNEEALSAGPPLTIQEAMTRAARDNAEVIVAREEERIRDRDRRLALSSLLPQASANASHGRTLFTDKIDPRTPDYAHEGAYGVELKQVLFNDELNSLVQAQRRNELAASFETRSRELDAMVAATDAYVDCLTTRALYGIEKEAAEAQSQLAKGRPIPMACLALILISQFNSIRRFAIILVTIPPMLIGVVPGLLLTGSSFGFMTLLGLIALMGIIVNNAILLLDETNLQLKGGKELTEAIVDAARSRLRPIFMTTITTIIGLVPLALGGGKMWSSMAFAMMFGLGFATLLTLLLCPVLFFLLFRRELLPCKNRSHGGSTSA